MGYIIYEQGMYVDLAKIQVIRYWLALATLIELRSFLGLTNFYHMCVLGFSHITWHLSQVTKGGAKVIFFLVQFPTKVVCVAEAAPLLYTNTYIARPVTTT